jgi:hypothetical protein
MDFVRPRFTTYLLTGWQPTISSEALRDIVTLSGDNASSLVSAQ